MASFKSSGLSNEDPAVLMERGGNAALALIFNLCLEFASLAECRRFGSLVANLSRFIGARHRAYDSMLMPGCSTRRSSLLGIKATFHVKPVKCSCSLLENL